MTRRSEINGQADDYVTRPPAMHDDVSANQRLAGVIDGLNRLSDAPVMFDADSDDEGAGPGLTVSIDVPVPARTMWLREVRDVRDGSGGIRSFMGGYKSIVNGRMRVRAGTLLLACIRTRTGNERICAYIILPDAIWYQTNFAPIARTYGWHGLIRSHLRTWTVLSRVQRVMRACTHSISDLLNAHRDASASERVNQSAAIAHLQEIRGGVANGVTDLEAATINNSFSGWVREIEETTGSTREEVMEALSGVIAPTPTTPTYEDVTRPLVTAMTTLGRIIQQLIGGNDDLSSANFITLDLLGAAIGAVTARIAEERQTRSWQRNVLGELDRGMLFERMTTETFLICVADRGLTHALRSSADAAISYFRITYGLTISREEMDRALLYASTEEVRRSQEQRSSQETEAEEQPPQRPAATTRQARNIRIGRRRTSG